jgi:hypothetical protein
MEKIVSLQELLSLLIDSMTVKEIARLSQCSKNLIALNKNERLWALLLNREYHMVAIKETTSRYCYKWNLTIGSKAKQISKCIVNCKKFSQLPEYTLGSNLYYAFTKAGPTMSIEVIWKRLKESEFVVPDELKHSLILAIEKIKTID